MWQLIVPLTLVVVAAAALWPLVTSPITLFTFHPIAMLLFVALVTLGIHQLAQSTNDTKTHAKQQHRSFIVMSVVMLITGVVIIETNKIVNGLVHFKSLHGSLGVSVAVVVLIQASFGYVVYSRSTWLSSTTAGSIKFVKMHRLFGYVLWLLLIFTAFLGVLQMGWYPTWIWATLFSIVVAGQLIAIQPSKLWS
jgi:uncharacterized MnhB-related membrane protein